MFPYWHRGMSRRLAAPPPWLAHSFLFQRKNQNNLMMFCVRGLAPCRLALTPRKPQISQNNLFSRCSNHGLLLSMQRFPVAKENVNFSYAAASYVTSHLNNTIRYNVTQTCKITYNYWINSYPMLSNIRPNSTFLVEFEILVFSLYEVC
jgi:hypothetical protein